MKYLFLSENKPLVKKVIKSKCHCVNVAPGEHTNTMLLHFPYANSENELISCSFSVDTCIADHIGWLWHNNIKTLASCCGHGKQRPAVCVEEKDIQRMLKMNYQLDFDWREAPVFFLD